MAQTDKYSANNALGSAREGFDITPGASELAQVPRALWVGTGGNVSLKFAGGATLVLKNVPDGTMLAVAPSHVLGATTAADLVGLV